MLDEYASAQIKIPTLLKGLTEKGTATSPGVDHDSEPTLRALILRCLPKIHLHIFDWFKFF